MVHGAYANFNESSDARNFNAAASLADNTVTVNGGQYNSGASFHGAYASLMTANLNAQPADTAKPTANLTGNKVTVSNTDFNKNNYIYGAYADLKDANGMYNNQTGDKGEFNITAVLQNNSVTVDRSTFNSNDTYTYNTKIYGAYAYLFYAVNSKADLLNNTVAINGGKFNAATNIYGACINLDHNGISQPTYDKNKNNNVNSYDNVASTVSGNNVTISGGEFNAATNVYGAYAVLTYEMYPAENTRPGDRYYTSTAAITDNTVTLTGSAGAYDEDTQARDLKNVNLYGYAYNDTAEDVSASQITDGEGNTLDKLKEQNNLGNLNNNLIVDGWSGTVGSVNNFANINFENIKVSKSDDETKAESVFYIKASGEDANKGLADTTVNINSVAAGDYAQGTELSGTLTLDSKINSDNIQIADKLQNAKNVYFASDNDDNGVIANKFSSISATQDENDKHLINLSASVDKTILAGKFIEADSEGNPIEHINSNGNASLTVDESLNDTNASAIAGAYAAGNKDATGGNIIVNGAVTKDLYAGYSENGYVKNNTLTLTGSADVSSVNLFGANTNTSGATEGNKLTIDDWKGTIKSLNNFAAIDFNNIAWENGSTVLTIADTDADLSSTQINLNSLKGGSTIKAGDTMTLD